MVIDYGCKWWCRFVNAHFWMDVPWMYMNVDCHHFCLVRNNVASMVSLWHQIVAAFFVKSVPSWSSLGSRESYMIWIDIDFWLVVFLEHDWIIFPEILRIIIPIDFHIFQRGWSTTNLSRKHPLKFINVRLSQVWFRLQHVEKKTYQHFMNVS